MKQKSKSAAKGQDKALPPASLSELCSEAADHVAKARHALFDDSVDPEYPLVHLDEAIFCLKRLLAYGRSSSCNGAQTGLR